MKDSSQPAKRRRYDATFRAEALGLVGENCSTKLLYKWQKEVLMPVAATRGKELAPATVAELRLLQALARQ